MNSYRYIKHFFCILATALAFAGCSLMEEPESSADAGYGYVQFKLYKEASYSPTKAVMSQINYLSDVSKIRVVMRFEGNDIAQTLVMNYSDKESAEYGLRSDKIKLLAGKYELAMFTLYDSLDQPLYESTPSGEFEAFEVVSGGLYVHDLTANTVERGKVKFNIVKDFSDFGKIALFLRADNAFAAGVRLLQHQQLPKRLFPQTAEPPPKYFFVRLCVVHVLLHQQHHLLA